MKLDKSLLVTVIGGNMVSFIGIFAISYFPPFSFYYADFTSQLGIVGSYGIPALIVTILGYSIFKISKLKNPFAVALIGAFLTLSVWSLAAETILITSAFLIHAIIASLAYYAAYLIGQMGLRPWQVALIAIIIVLTGAILQYIPFFVLRL